MFSDNQPIITQIIGENPMYDNLVKSMDSYNKHNSLAFYNGFVCQDNIRYFKLCADKYMRNHNDFKDLHHIMNLSSSNVYYSNAQAIDHHQTMMYAEVFTKEQWQAALSLVDVFDFNTDSVRMLNEYILNAKSYIKIYGYRMLHEFGNYKFLCDENYKDILTIHVLENKPLFEQKLKALETDITQEFTNIDSTTHVKKKNNQYTASEKDPELFLNLVKYTAQMIYDLTDKYPYSLFTILLRIRKLISDILCETDNPYQYQYV